MWANPSLGREMHRMQEAEGKRDIADCHMFAFCFMQGANEQAAS